MSGKPRLALDQVLWECFRHFAHLDESNAAMHTAQVRYSPITFRVAEHLEHLDLSWLYPTNASLLDNVLRARGTYEEDAGR